MENEIQVAGSEIMVPPVLVTVIVEGALGLLIDKLPKAMLVLETE